MLLILVNRRTVVLPKRVRGVSDKAKVLENSLKKWRMQGTKPQKYLGYFKVE